MEYIVTAIYDGEYEDAIVEATSVDEALDKGEALFKDADDIMVCELGDE